MTIYAIISLLTFPRRSARLEFTLKFGKGPDA